MTSMWSRSLSTWLPLETHLKPWRKIALPEHLHFSKYSKIILFCVLILKRDYKFSCWVSLLLHLSVGRNVHVLALVSSVAVSRGLRVSFQIMVFSEYTHLSGITGSHGSSVYSFLRNLNILLHHGCTHLRSHQQCRRVPFSPHTILHLLFADFLRMIILTCDVISHWGSKFCFSDNEWCWPSFTCCWPFVCLLRRNVCLGFWTTFELCCWYPLYILNLNQ